MLDTSNPNNYNYITKHLEIHILGGIKTNKLESLRVTISIQKPKEYNIVRQSIDLYNDNQIEKLVRKAAERLEIGTSVVRREFRIKESTLRRYHNALENEGYIKERKDIQSISKSFEVLVVDEFQDLENTIDKALKLCLDLAGSPQGRHIQNGELKPLINK